MKTTLIALLSTVSAVMGHGYVQEFLIGGQRYTGSLPFQDPYMHPAPDRITQPFWENGNSFIDDVTSIDIACNKGAKPAKLVATAPAGSEVTFFWTEWPASHKGPVITYLADCGGDCTTAVGSQLNWFKIDEAGFLADGTWAAEKLIKNNNTWTLTLPQKIKNGQYLMRHEIIALHGSHEMKGTQFYPSCTNIEITGATGENTPETVKFPGAYSATDPGIFLNIYYPKVTNYTIPGPAPYTEDGASSPKPQEPVSSAPAASSSFPTFVPTATQGVFPTGSYPVGTEGALAPTVTAVPEPTKETPEQEPEADDEPETVTTTIVTTVAGQPITMTATYVATGCPASDDTETDAPEPTVEPVATACGTVTVTDTVIFTVTDKYVVGTLPAETVTVTTTAKYEVGTITRTVTVTEVPTAAPTTAAPTAIPTTAIPEPPTTAIPEPPAETSVDAVPITTELPTGFETIPFPSAATATASPTVEPVPSSTTVDSYEPSGTGAPLTGYESALTRRDCDEAFMKCQRSFEGCMKRAKRSGMQTRSCEKFKRDVCVEGLRGCDARVWGYKS